MYENKRLRPTYAPTTSGRQKKRHRQRGMFVRNLLLVSLVLAAAVACTAVLVLHLPHKMTGSVVPSGAASQVSTGSSAAANALSAVSGSNTVSSQAVPSSAPAASSGAASAGASAAVESVPQITSAIPASVLASEAVASVGPDSAEKPVWVSVSTASQTLTVYGKNGDVVKKCICSTGLVGDDTPTGTYHVYDRGKSFYSYKYEEGAYYWVRFYGSYLLHSIPFGPDRNILPTEAAKLGQKASHGCVRLAMADAKWMYEYLPNGTKVVIQ